MSRAQAQLTLYAENGLRLFPLKARSKEPLQVGYATKSYTLDQLAGQNVGLLIDPGYADVDLDWREARQLFTSFLPQTESIFGRGDPFEITHLLYSAECQPRNFQLPKVHGAPTLEGEHGSMILQLRTTIEGEAYHVMIPPSVHPDGTHLKWAHITSKTAGLPSDIEADKLMTCLGQLAAASFFVRFYPIDGCRDDFALALTGALARGEWTPDAIERFISIVARAAGDEEHEMRSSKAKRSIARLETGRKVAGLPKLAQHLGVPIEWIRQVAVWLGIRKDSGSPPVFLSDEVVNNSRQAWTALAEYTVNGSPGVYRYGTLPARVDAGELQRLDGSAFQHELNRAAKWLKPKADKKTGELSWSPTSAPLPVVYDMLAARLSHMTVPELVQVTSVPVFTHDGKLVTQPGFDFDTGIFYAPSCDVEEPDSLAAAVELLWEVIGDFPFVHDSDRAHTFALFFEHICRNLWRGPSPIYVFNKPTRGTGASLVVSAITSIPIEGGAPAKTQPKAEEWEKVITAKLIEGAAVVSFDNVAGHIDAEALAAATTATTYNGRVLGKSQTMSVPVRCSWVMTGNNPSFSDELQRRIVDIRMDAGVENPEARPPSTFKHPKLLKWIGEHRGRLVGAVIKIVREWVERGMPAGTKSKASYEDWARVIGGILDVAGVSGFLETPADRASHDPKTENVRGLIVTWLRAMRGVEGEQIKHVDWQGWVKAGDLVSLIAHTGLPFDYGYGNNEVRMIGHKLRAFKDSVFSIETKTGSIRAQLRLGYSQNATRYRLEYERADDADIASVKDDPTPF